MAKSINNHPFASSALCDIPKEEIEALRLRDRERIAGIQRRQQEHEAECVEKQKQEDMPRI